ncbi:membrane protein insertase YidC [Oscillatoria amoena NRMC-F 0135]|nr:membrane protein insertase YidC [Oscillatoria amoena NRMC-F 0135]
MDRNQAIGLTLIAVVLLGYFLWFAPRPEPIPQQVPTFQQLPADSTADVVVAETLQKPDSVLTAAFGNLSGFLSGEEQVIPIETEDMKISFSTKGGVIKELELKNYKTYSGKPLKLIEPRSNTFQLTSHRNGGALDLYALHCQVNQTRSADTTRLTFVARIDENNYFEHTYSIPARGFQIGYTVKAAGLSSELSENLTFQWTSFLRLLERDLADSRINTTITYHYNGSMDELAPRSTSVENETFAGNLQWVTFKQKFFLSSFISSKGFPGGEIETAVNEADTSVVKRANVKVFIPSSALSGKGSVFSFYFGPNDYKAIGKVAPDFAKNVYLGWPPVYWINKYVIFPVFHFLTKSINNFGLIIIILVILLRIVLLPLSYKSYLSMAKMKVLKPELDEIKEKFGEDMSKVQQEQLKLYQQAGVNPISGCVPILLQMPILFAMFYLFPNSIELRQQSFLWADDLSTYDSIINLPFTIPLYGSHVSLWTLLMTISTLVITWQNNQVSSVQGPMKSMSYIMPVVFLFVLNTFPAGLSFYYFMSNIITFGQQAIIRRFVDEGKIKHIMDEHRRTMAAGGGKKSRFMSKLEEAMKASEESRKKSEEQRRNKKK